MQIIQSSISNSANEENININELSPGIYYLKVAQVGTVRNFYDLYITHLYTLL